MILRVLNKIFNRKLPKEAKNPLNRKLEGGQLLNLSLSYLQKQDKLIGKYLLPRIYENTIHCKPESYYDELLFNSAYSELGERVVEYSWILKNFIVLERKDNFQLLDAGCVLNNKVISEYITDIFDMIWFMNPAQEKLVYKKNVAYLLKDICSCTLPFFESVFDVVTCLSTLEHIGMDNRRYGVDVEPNELSIISSNPESFAIEAINNLSYMVKPGGKLYISVPFGPFEYLYAYGDTTNPIYYTFNQEMLLKLFTKLDEFNVNLAIYKVVPSEGWVKTDITDKNIVKYAENCVGSGAVALTEATKKN